MEDELIYQYPIQDDNGEGARTEIEKLMSIRRKTMLRTRLISAIILVMICILYIFSNHSSVIPVIIIVLLGMMFFFGKSISSGTTKSDFYTEISAYDSYLEIKLTNISNGIIEQASIDFDDIEWAMMSRSLERIQICFLKNNSEMLTYSLNNNQCEQSNGDFCLIDIPLNSYTYQQYYFLYIAGDYFKIRIPKTLNNDRIIFKKYGYSDDYLKHIS